MNHVIHISQLEKIKKRIVILGYLVLAGVTLFFTWEAYLPYATKVGNESKLFHHIKKESPQKKLDLADDETIRAFIQQSGLDFKIYIPFQDVIVTYNRHDVPADQARPLLMGYVLDVHLMIFGWELYSDRIIRVLPVAGTQASGAPNTGK